MFSFHADKGPYKPLIRSSNFLVCAPLAVIANAGRKAFFTWTLTPLHDSSNQCIVRTVLVSCSWRCQTIPYGNGSRMMQISNNTDMKNSTAMLSCLPSWVRLRDSAMELWFCIRFDEVGHWWGWGLIFFFDTPSRQCVNRVFADLKQHMGGVVDIVPIRLVRSAAGKLVLAGTLLLCLSTLHSVSRYLFVSDSPVSAARWHLHKLSYMLLLCCCFNG